MRMLPDRESQNRALSLGVLLLVPLVSFAIWYAVTTPPEHDDEFPGILQRYGYSAMALPSRLFGPGTIMTVETLRSGALDLHLACRIDDPGLEAKWQRSPAMNLSFAAGVRRAFKSSVLASHLASSHPLPRGERGSELVGSPQVSLSPVGDGFPQRSCGSEATAQVAWREG